MKNDEETVFKTPPGKLGSSTDPESTASGKAFTIHSKNVASRVPKRRPTVSSELMDILEGKIVDLEKKLAYSESRERILENEKIEGQKDIELAKKDKELLQNQLHRQREVLNVIETSLASANKEKRELSNRIAELEAKLNRAEDKSDEAAEKHKLAMEKLRLETENVTLRRELRVSKENNEALKEKIVQIEENFAIREAESKLKRSW